MHILESLKRRRKTHNKLLWGFTLLLYLYIFVAWATNNLGINPFETLIQYSAHWAVIFYVLSYVISPARRLLNLLAIKRGFTLGKRLSDWNFLLYQRRMLGVNCFYFASLHLFIYLYLELDFEFSELVLEISERRFIQVGLLAWFILSVLAFTSLNFFKGYLKFKWFLLHRLTHVVAVLILLHMLLELKTMSWYFGIYTTIIVAAAAERLISYFGGNSFMQEWKRSRRKRLGG